MDDVRFLVLKMLDKTFDSNGFSNLILDSALNRTQLGDKDKRFCSMLYYGVIERKITLDYIISGYSKKPINKLDLSVLNILRCGLYQIKYMDSVPESAAINESVKLTRKVRLASASGFVNAVLRNFSRDGMEIIFPDNITKKMSVDYSSPEWLVKKLLYEYGEQITKSVLESSISVPPVTIRLNTVIADEKMLFESMDGIKLEKNKFLADCYDVSGGDLISSEAYKNGFFHVQDIASQLCCMALGVKKNDIVLDLCSAPGGKAFTIAQLLNGTGTVYAFDIHEKRVKLIQDGAGRLKLENINAKQNDALIYNSEISVADKILCDVPCSGLGVIRRKPEIKYKNPVDFKNLPELQYKILKNAVKYLKIGGELVYSTCTLNKNENDEVIDRFLADNSDFEGVSFLEDIGKPFGKYKTVLYPDYFNSDGFFISKIRKTGD